MAGKPAYQADVSGSEDGIDMVGRFVVVAVSPMQQFLFVGFSSAEHWDNEIAPLYSAVLDTVQFFEPIEVPAE